MSEPVIEVEGLWKRYDLHPAHSVARKVGRAVRRLRGLPPPEEFFALRDVSFRIGRGRVVGVIGPNGAGKSTLLKILCRVTAATRGRVAVHGRTAPLIDLGAGFHLDLTGRENTIINAVMLGMTRREVRQKYGEIVDFAGVGDFMDAQVKRFSWGMLMRLGFSVAVHSDPDILLVDEVLAVGDAVFRARCFERIRAMIRKGVTVLLVTHDPTQIQRLCTEVLYLDKGVLQFMGEAKEALGAYQAVASELSARQRILKSAAQALQREGSQACTVESVSFSANGQDGAKIVRMFDDLTLRVRLRYNEPARQAGVRAELHSEAYGLVNAFFMMPEASGEMVPKGAVQTFECRIPDIRLMGGAYHFDLHVEGDVQYDIVPNAVAFQAVLSDQQVTLATEGHGIFYSPFTWELRREDDAD